MEINVRDTSTSLFSIALGLSELWKVSEVIFNEDKGRLDIKIKREENVQFLCEQCDKSCSIYDTNTRVWRHLNFFQYETYLEAEVPRIECDTCKVIKNVSVPWARSNTGFTLLFEAFVIQLAQAMPLSTVGGIIGEHDTRLMRIVKHYVEKARRQVDMSEVQRLSTDETSKAKGHDYITTFINIPAAQVLFATPGKDNTTVKRFVDDLHEHGGDSNKITEACVDLSPAFSKSIRENLPEATIVYDRFHVMKLVTDAQDIIRREEVKNHPILNGSRYAFLHNPETATERQTETLKSLTKLNIKTVRSYQIRLALRDVYMILDSKEAEKALTKWYFWATHSRIDPIIKVAKTIKKHWDGVLAFFQNRTANGIAEGINSVIQTIGRRARGYKNVDNFITMVYLVCGKLQFNLPKVCAIDPR